MILADKIIDLRKKAGMSQEELAARIGVSRQAVSKWESAQSTPDMNKIIALSDLFGVSTDYLLKDNIDSPQSAPLSEQEQARQEQQGHTYASGAEEEALHPVDMETASRFLANNVNRAGMVALGVMLCIFSPIALMILLTAQENGAVPLTESQAIAVGMIVLLSFVVIAIILFITSNVNFREFEFLEREPLDTAYGVDGMVREKRKEYESTHLKDMIIGVVLCVASCMPLFVASLMVDEDVIVTIGAGVLLVMVGIGVFFIVRTSTIWGGFQVLLEEGDYTRDIKRRNKNLGGIYWPIVTAVYLVISFVTFRWDVTWIVWPIAAALFGVLDRVINRNQNRRVIV